MKIQHDKNLNCMPHKAKSIGRIDGIAALIMAIGRYTASMSESSRRDVPDQAYSYTATARIPTDVCFAPTSGENARSIRERLPIEAASTRHTNGPGKC